MIQWVTSKFWFKQQQKLEDQQEQKNVFVCDAAKLWNKAPDNECM